MNEKEIINQHLVTACRGFTALQQITAFCCCGCGLCVSICPEGAIAFNELSKRPELSGTCNKCGLCYLACPRSFLPLSRIRAAYYGNDTNGDKKRLGNYCGCFAARSLNDDIYRSGTPGGTTSALVYYLLQKKYVSSALLTRGKHRDIEYCMHPETYIAATPEAVLQSGHSKFEITPVLSRLRDLSGAEKSLVVGTPCHILGIRKLQVICEDRVLKKMLNGFAEAAQPLIEKIRYCIAINCFLNHTSMDKIYAWLNLDEGRIRKFNENTSKDLFAGALRDGKDRRWLYRNNVVTSDGKEIEYDVYELGRRVLASGCLICESRMVSREADVSIGMFGADCEDGDFGWNSVVVMNPELQKIFDLMVSEGILGRKPLLQNSGTVLRKTAEWAMNMFWPVRDIWGVEHYLATGEWLYPSGLKKLKGTRRALIRGKELIYLAQTIRHKIFYEPTIKSLTRLQAYTPTIY